MKQLRRRLRRSNDQRRSQFLASSGRTTRRALIAERLEGRAMMAADFAYSPYWNAYKPTDVDGDGMTAPLDALVVINALNAGIGGSLIGGGSINSNSIAGEGESTQPQYYYDVDNDGSLTPLDALIVINRLNAEGEDDGLIRYIIQPVSVNDLDGNGQLDDVITEINKGEDFELRVLVQDVRDGGRGVFAGYIDVLTDTSKLDLYISEVQHLEILGNTGTSKGTFTLTYNGQTTAPINWDGFAGNSRAVVAANIEAALIALPNIGPNDIDVIHEPLITSPSDPTPSNTNRFNIRFKGELGDIDQSLITVNYTPTSGSVPTFQVTETAKGGVETPDSVREAFRSPTNFVTGVKSYKNGLSGSIESDRLKAIGAFGDSTPTENETLELVRARFTAVEGGLLTFEGSVEDVNSIQHRTLVYFSNVGVPKEDIAFLSQGLPLGPDNFAPATLLIKEPVSAGDDSATTNEDTAVIIDVRANDVDNGPNVSTLTIQSVDTTTLGTQGSVTINANGTVTYTPPANFNGSTQFRYTIRDAEGNTDTATVTVTVNPVNDAPLITLPGAPLATEDTDLVLSGPSAITINDVDADTSPISVTLTASNGTLTLSTIAGLQNVVGNGTSNVVTFQGPQAAVNAALNGLRYTPPANFNGPVTLQVNTNDQGATGGPAATDSKTLNFTVSPVNDAPVNTVPGPQTVVEDEELVLPGLSVADIDAGESNPPTVRTTLAVNLGTLDVTASVPGAIITGDGTASVTIEGTIAQVNAALVGIIYRPNTGIFEQTDTVTMTTSDLGHNGPSIQTDIDTFQIEIESAILPRARRDEATVLEDSVDNQIFVLANDRANSGATPVFVTIITQPSHGTVSATINDNGTPADHTDDYLEYTPDPDFFGTDFFEYSINDTLGTGLDSIARVDITVTNTPDVPVASDDSYTTDEDVPLNIPAPGVLDNDVDVDLDTLTATIVDQPANGTVTLNSDGSFTYTPNANFNGSDSFTYTAGDGTSPSNVATVFITINPVDDAPVAGNDAYTVDEEDTLTVPAPGVLSNDSDVEMQPLTAILVTAPAHGSLTFNSDGSFVYTPNTDFFGTDTFTYKVNDGSLDSPPATVTITVNNINDAPVAADDTYNATEDTPLVTTVANGVLANDSDTDGPMLVAVLVSEPSNGTLVFNADGTFVYTPDANFNGTDSFEYRASDGPLSSAIVTVTINVAAVNDAPVGGNDSYTGALEDSVLTIDAANGVLDNDSDVDGDSIDAVIATVTSAKGATVTIRADGGFDYDPRNAPQLQALGDGVTTTDNFTYQVTDGQLTGTATVTITITGENDDPTAADDTADAIANIPVEINVLGNDTDIDVGDTLSIGTFDATSTEGGTITLGQNGRLIYTAPEGFEGTDTFTYQVSDGKGGFDTATVTVAVVNYIPTDITGYVYIDRTSTAQPNGNGLFEAGERGVAGVNVTLSSPTGVDMFGNPFTPITTTTDATGRYFFNDIIPGNYVITQEQPAHLRDGKESVAEPNYASVNAAHNNNIFITLPQLGAPDGLVEGNNFAELGIDASTLDDSRGLLQEMLASSSQNGMVISTNMAGETDWFWALNNWNNVTNVKIQLSSNLATATLTVWVSGVPQTPITIGQVPNGSNNARFRILGSTDEGGYLIRLDGTFNEFFAASSQAQGEGESGGDADSSYVDSVDHVLAEQSWA